MRPALIPVVPDVPGLRFQAVHSLDVGDAYRLAIAGDARGAFNIAAEPVLDPPELARILGARLLPVPRGVLRSLVSASWHLHLQPTPPGWVDLALGVPLLDVSHARAELDWEPKHSSEDALLELIGGIHDRAGAPTPPLDPHSGGPARTKELATGVGSR